MVENENEILQDEEILTAEVETEEEDEDEDYEEELDDELESLLDPSGAEAKRVASRPDISSLEDAFEPGFDGVPLPKFTVGGKIVLERYATTLPKRQWLSTNTYIVEDINYETGTLKLWDPSLQRFELSNWRTALSKHGFVYKLAPAHGVVGKKRGRGRPRKNPFVPPAPKAEGVAPGPEDKKGRGRPKGSKNRSKEEIAKDRQVKAAARAAK